jgi:hypothetical protein
MQSRLQLCALLPQLIRQLPPLQCSEHESLRLFPQFSWQLAPEEQLSTPAFALSPEAVQVDPVAQLNWQWSGPEQLSAQLHPDGQD